MVAHQAESVLDPVGAAFYREILEALNRSDIPFLVGGAYSFARYTGIERHTKDFDIFIMREDLDRTLELFGRSDCRTERTFHWLAKAYRGEHFIDVIYSGASGIAHVDAAWFAHGVPDEVLGVPVRLCPAEETIWSKSFVMERERYDGADIQHLLQARAGQLDWQRLLDRFAEHWRLLLSTLVLFGFVYPAERAAVPAWVMATLIERLQAEVAAPAPNTRVCGGTLISREQYLSDVTERGYLDPRLQPLGSLSAADLEIWNADIKPEQ
jgi:hypothetical protein